MVEPGDKEIEGLRRECKG